MWIGGAAIYVKDIEKACSFFRRYFAGRVVRREINHSKGRQSCIYLQTAPEIYFDLKTEPCGIMKLQMEMNDKGKVRIHVFEKDDYFSLINAMTG